MSNVLRYGSPGEALSALARSNFTDARFSLLSFSTTPVEILSNAGGDEVLSHGTGFFWREGEQDWVITAWHVISGKNPFSGQSISRQGLIPKRIKVHGWKIGDSKGQIELLRTGYTITIPDKALERIAEAPLIDGRVVDIFALPIPHGFALEKPESGLSAERFREVSGYLNLYDFDKVATQAGDELAILGYPLANHTGLLLPIWKRGSLSTDSNMPLDELPGFLIDAATSSAMSGSPVLRVVKVLAPTDPSTQLVSEIRGFQMVGVYAGRLQSKELEQVGIGYAWFASLIPSIVRYSLPIWEAAVQEI